MHVPDPIISADGELHPEDEAVLADSVGLALLVVLDTLTPAERLAFVLHDMFDLPFEEIAPMVGRVPTAARQLASRARRRVQGADLPPRRTISPVNARSSTHSSRLLAVASSTGSSPCSTPTSCCDRTWVARRRAATALVRGAEAVAGQAIRFALPNAELHPALVNGGAGVVVMLAGRPFAVMGFTVVDGRIVEIDAIADPERVRRLATAVVS